MKNTYPKLNKVLENLEVLVIEQSEDNKLFNRGKVLNVGFKYYDEDVNPINEKLNNYIYKILYIK